MPVSSVQRAFLARMCQYRTCVAECSAKHLTVEVVGSEGTERSNCAERVASKRVQAHYMHSALTFSPRIVIKLRRVV